MPPMHKNSDIVEGKSILFFLGNIRKYTALYLSMKNSCEHIKVLLKKSRGFYFHNMLPFFTSSLIGGNNSDF